MKQLFVTALIGVLICIGTAGSCVALTWWLSDGSMDGVAAWNTFGFLLLVFFGCGLLVGLPSLIEALWEARPSVRAARAEEAERRAQSELKRAMLIAAERKARMERQRQILHGVAAGFEAWTRQWELEHPEEASILVARRQAQAEAEQQGCSDHEERQV